MVNSLLINMPINDNIPVSPISETLKSAKIKEIP